MYTYDVNIPSKEVQRFCELAKQYYNVDDSSGYFLDLGANIGTTSIYFNKNFAPDLKILAFEPDDENFKLLRINTILNDVEDKVTLVNLGLGDQFTEMTMYRDLKNPGSNTVARIRVNAPQTTIKIIPLDSYLAENKIPAQAVKYIWIDTEGFEAQVLLGAKNLLKENPAPIWLECNLGAWDNSGLFDDLMTLLAESYSHFILFEHGKEILYPLEELKTIERSSSALGRRGDIFLIKKGAID